ncbi:hypothetical protein ACS0TY_031718 [Phlomoides rotata]
MIIPANPSLVSPPCLYISECTAEIETHVMKFRLLGHTMTLKWKRESDSQSYSTLLSSSSRGITISYNDMESRRNKCSLIPILLASKDEFAQGIRHIPYVYGIKILDELVNFVGCLHRKEDDLLFIERDKIVSWKELNTFVSAICLKHSIVCASFLLIKRSTLLLRKIAPAISQALFRHFYCLERGIIK